MGGGFFFFFWPPMCIAPLVLAPSHPGTNDPNLQEPIHPGICAWAWLVLFDGKIRGDAAVLQPHGRKATCRLSIFPQEEGGALSTDQLLCKMPRTSSVARSISPPGVRRPGSRSFVAAVGRAVGRSVPCLGPDVFAVPLEHRSKLEGGGSPVRASPLLILLRCLFFFPLGACYSSLKITCKREALLLLFDRHPPLVARSSAQGMALAAPWL